MQTGFRTSTIGCISGLAFLLTGPPVHADTITVCWDGSGVYLTIQEGIDAAVDGDEVVVCDGVYTGDGNRDLDFHGKAITVRSANGPDNCIIDCEYEGRGFYLHTGETASSVIRALTITSGYAADDGPGGPRGGGVYCLDSSPTLVNCVITGCATGGLGEGGGIYCGFGDPTIDGCLLSSNFAGFDGAGGGVHCDHSNPTLYNCTIFDNGAAGPYDIGSGGGVFCNASDPVLVRCRIVNNFADRGGGCLLHRQPSHAR